MADSAFEREDMRLFKRGMDHDVGGVCIALERNEIAGFADTKTIFSFMSANDLLLFLLFETFSHKMTIASTFPSEGFAFGFPLPF